MQAATVPAGFSETLVASGLASPTAMQFAPDGRLFVAEQGGRLRVIKDGVLLPTPFLTLTVSSAGERGLLGVAFDPAFATNRFVYVYYTATTPAIHNRISRFTANGDVAVAGSEVVLLDLNNLSSATNHNGGALAFGGDGKLYVAVGENANGANAQSFSNLLGKMLRLNSDGSIPTDNPFFGSASGNNRAIYSLGLRNPFTFAFSSGLRPDVHQRRRPEHVGRDQRRHRRRQLRLAGYRRRDDRPEVRQPAARLQPLAGLRDHRRRVLRAVDSPVSRRIPERLLLRRLLRRLDPQARSGSGQHRRAVCQRHPVARRSQSRRRRQPVLPGAWIGCLDRRRVSDLVHGEHAQHHHAPVQPDGRAGRVGDVQRARIGPAAAPLSVAAQRRQHLRRDGAGLHARRQRSRQRRAIPRHRQQRRRQRAQQRSGADGHLEPAAHGHDHAAGSRARSTAAAASSPTPERQRIRRTGRSRRAPSPGGSISTTTRTRTRSSPRRPARRAARSRFRRPDTPKPTSGTASS